jgi:hypothetical protein
MWLSRVLLCLGLSVGSLSMWDTLSHSWDPAFQAPALSLGPTHTNYHAFREFTLTVGAVSVMLYVMFLPQSMRLRSFWVIMAVTSVCYYGGWWLPWPLLGLHAPNAVATIVHLAATVLSLSGVALAWRSFPNTEPASGPIEQSTGHLHS